jgi:hypothetical protein
MIKKAGQSDDFGVIKKLLPNDVSDGKTPRAAEDIENVMEAEPIKLDQVPADKLNLAIASDSSQDNVVCHNPLTELYFHIIEKTPFSIQLVSFNTDLLVYMRENLCSKVISLFL